MPWFPRAVATVEPRRTDARVELGRGFFRRTESGPRRPRRGYGQPMSSSVLYLSFTLSADQLIAVIKRCFPDRPVETTTGSMGCVQVGAGWGSVGFAVQTPLLDRRRAVTVVNCAYNDRPPLEKARRENDAQWLDRIRAQPVDESGWRTCAKLASVLLGLGDVALDRHEQGGWHRFDGQKWVRDESVPYVDPSTGVLAAYAPGGHPTRTAHFAN
ncbi:MAG: hypothetical protein JWM76_861 [Pseudonocardiales bacterium]|nr:hypothetical protein [Pseudonocardiales bacterium]